MGSFATGKRQRPDADQFNKYESEREAAMRKWATGIEFRRQNR
jgi:hypothetical protein